MDKCKFHPDRFAHVRCKTCFIPLCDDCKIVTNIGVFCSEICHDRAKAFQDKTMALAEKKPKRRGSPLKMLLRIIIIIILIAAIAIGLDMAHIVTLPFVESLKSLIELGG